MATTRHSPPSPSPPTPTPTPPTLKPPRRVKTAAAAAILAATVAELETRRGIRNATRYFFFFFLFFFLLLTFIYRLFTYRLRVRQQLLPP
jgi:hypothetical protein